MSFRRLSGSILASAALVAGCSGGGSPGVVPASGNVAAAAGPASGPSIASQDHRRGSNPRHIAFLVLTVDASGKGTFAFARGDRDDAMLEPKSDETVSIAAFTLTCPEHRDNDARRRGDEDRGWCPFRRGDDDADDGHYYVREITQIAGRDSRHGDDDDSRYSAVAISGPETATTKTSASFPAVNAPLALAAGTRYYFDLVKSRAVLATPTPPPTPAPTDPCPKLPLESPVTHQPKAISFVAGDATTIQPIAQSFNGNVRSISCAVNGKMYFTAKFFLNGATYQFDPAASTTTQWSTAAGDDTVTGGDSHVYEQGAFGKVKTSQLAQFSLDGTTQTYVAGGLPNFLVTGPDGNVYTVLNNGTTESVEQVKPDASVTQYSLPAACGTSFDADASGPGGMLWFHSTACGLMSMTTSGTFAKVALFSDSVAHMTAGPDGALYVTDTTSPAIVRIDPVNGTTITWALPGNLQPNGVIRGHGPTVWFDAYDSNAGTEQIDVLDLVTGVITQFDQGGAALSSSYTIGPDGNIYTFSSNGGKSILRINGAAKF